jgi:broad specificity phosphatase PhoE
LTSVCLSRAGAEAAAVEPVEMEHVVIYKEESLYSCFPEMQKLPGGDLIANFSRRERRSHVDGSGPGNLIMRSKDGGLTWQADETASWALPEWETDRGEWVRVTDEGWNEADISEKERLEAEGYRVRVRGVSEGRVAYLTPYFRIYRSTDEGETWSEERQRAPDNVRALFHMFETHTTLVTSTGVHIRALYGRATDGSGNSEIYFFRSEDDGVSWDFVRLQPEGPGENGFDETSLIETPDGRLLIMLRTQPAGYLWQSFSDDMGKTWSAPEEAGIWGFPGHLLALPDGRILCTYGYRRAPMGIRARISRDNGKTWDLDSEIVLRDDGKGRGGDLGYPTSIALDDGSIFTIYYMNLEDNVTHIAGTKWKLPPTSDATE